MSTLKFEKKNIFNKQTKTCDLETKTGELDSRTTDNVSSCEESSESITSNTKVWSDASIIEEYESGREDSCAFVNSVKHVKKSLETC